MSRPAMSGASILPDASEHLAAALPATRAAACNVRAAAGWFRTRGQHIRADQLLFRAAGLVEAAEAIDAMLYRLELESGRVTSSPPTCAVPAPSSPSGPAAP